MRVLHEKDEVYIAGIERDIHKLKYISWRKEAVIYGLDNDEWNTLIDGLEEEKEVKNITKNKTPRAFWHGGMWHFDKSKEAIYMAKEAGEYVIYERDMKSAALIDSRKNDVDDITGGEAYKALSDKFQSRVGMKFQKAFGAFYKDEDREIAEGIHFINRCNGPFIWANDDYNNRVVEGVQKADLSAAYPFAGCGRLPDAHTMKVCKGTVEPDEEFPFAYYIKSGHVAEYGVFSTFQDQFSFLFVECRNPNHRKSKKKEAAAFFKYVPKDEEITVLMKASKYELTDEFNYFYDKRKEDPVAKAVCNLSIGRFDYIPYEKKITENGMVYELLWNRCRYMGHIRAIILARHNHRMISLYSEMKRGSGELVSIQTDAMTWKGKPINSQETDKHIGGFITEITDGRVYQHYCGCYYIECESQKIIKYQGVKNFPKDNLDNMSMDEFIDFFNGEIEYDVEVLGDDRKVHTVKRRI